MTHPQLKQPNNYVVTKKVIERMRSYLNELVTEMDTDSFVDLNPYNFLDLFEQLIDLKQPTAREEIKEVVDNLKTDWGKQL